MKSLRFWTVFYILVSTSLVILAGTWVNSVAQITVVTLTICSFVAGIGMIALRKIARNQTEARNYFVKTRTSLDSVHETVASLHHRQTEQILQVEALAGLQHQIVASLEDLGGHQEDTQEQIRKLEQLTARTVDAQATIEDLAEERATKILAVVEGLSESQVKSLGVIGRQMISIDSRVTNLSANLRETNANMDSVASLVTELTLRTVMRSQCTGTTTPEVERDQDDQ